MSSARMSLILLAFAIACAKDDPLQPLEPINLASTATNSVKVNFCTEPAYDQKQYLKTIIILDHSTSNQNNFRMLPDGSGLPVLPLDNGPQYATDPLGTFRYGNVLTTGSLLNYLSTLAPNNPADPLRYFASIDFSSDVTTYPANSSGFTSDIPAFYNYMQTQAGINGGSPDDVGSTNYLRALEETEAIIDADIAQAQMCANRAKDSTPDAQCPLPGVQIASSYIIVFVSDGAPITSFLVDTTQNPPTIDVTRQPGTDILGMVATIAGKVNNYQYVTSVNMFTVYYYNPANNPDTTASNLLLNMARIGNGINYVALSNTNLDWTQFQVPRKRITYTVSDVFVTNESVSWWNDGKLRADTDLDGLPDETETTFGTDPAIASTSGNGIKDLVRYHLANGVCNNKNATGRCTDAFPANVNSVCNGIPRTAGVWRESDPNGLNDCEKRLLSNTAGIRNPDSNGDLIPDWLQFKNGIQFQVGTTPAVNTPNQDGYTLYQKVKYSMPMNISAQQMLNLKPARYKSVLKSSTPDQSCFEVTVDDLPTIGDDNHVRVDIIMKSDLLQTAYLYRVGKKQFVPGQHTLVFQDWYDPSEQMPLLPTNTWKLWP